MYAIMRVNRGPRVSFFSFSLSLSLFRHSISLDTQISYGSWDGHASVGTLGDMSFGR